MDAGTFRVFHEIGLLIILKSFSSVQYNCECPGVLHMHNEQHILFTLLVKQIDRHHLMLLRLL